MAKASFRLLLLILCLAIVIRVAWTVLAPSSLDRLPDQREYLTLGQNLLHHGTLCFFDLRFNQTVWAYRMPGYPLFLAACGGSIRIVRLVQCVIDVSTLWATFLIAQRLTASVGVASVAAAIMAVNPFYIYFSGLILSETLFAALLAWGIWLLLCQKWALAAVVFIADCYVRPSGLLLLPFLMLAAGMNQSIMPAYPAGRIARRIAVATTFTVIGLLPWAWRNHHTLGVWMWTTTNGGITAYDGFHKSVTGSSDQRFIADFPQLSSMNEVGRSRFFTRQAVRWARENPGELPALSVRKILRGWSPVPLSKEFGKPLYRFASAMYALPFDLLCVLGLFSSRLTRGAKLLLITPAIYFTLVQVMSVGSIRYRMPAEAPLALIAAVGAVDLVRWKTQEQRSV